MKHLKLKVLFVISFFYPHHGGAEQQALLLSQQLQRRGCQASVLTRKFPGLKLMELLHGVPVFRSIRTIRCGKFFGISYFFTCLWFLLMKRQSYDIVHCYILQGFHSLAAIVMKYLFGKKVVIRISATGPLSDFLLLRKGLGGSFFLRCARKADRIIVLCSQSQQEAVAAGFRPQRIALIPNGVDTDFFLPAESRLAASCRILFIGRLDAMKGVDILLKAVADLRQCGITAYCTIIGDGPVRQELLHCARALALEGQIVFCGACSNIVPHLQQASIFVLPSHSEGVPNVILEAMACAVPIVATSVGGIPDLIQDGHNGLLVPPADVQSLSSALRKLIVDRTYARRLGDQARKDAQERYSLDAITLKYIALYQTLLPPT